MSRKKGMTLLMLIIYIVVAMIIVSAIIFNISNSNDIININKYTFQATMQEYINQYDSMKSYYELKGEFVSNLSIRNSEEDIYYRTISDYITTMTNEHKSFLCIYNGELCYYGLDENDIREAYLIEIGINGASN